MGNDKKQVLFRLSDAEYQQLEAIKESMSASTMNVAFKAMIHSYFKSMERINHLQDKLRISEMRFGSLYAGHVSVMKSLLVLKQASDNFNEFKDSLK